MIFRYHRPMREYMHGGATRAVLCGGNAGADVTARPIRAIPGKGKLGLIDSIGLFTGGCAVNSGIALARLGMKPTIGTAVGRDGFGEFLLRRLRENRVDLGGAQVVGGFQSSSTVVLVTPDGERSFLHTEGASGAITDRMFPDSLLKKHRILHLSGFFLLPRLDGPPARRLLARAKKLGLTTSFDSCWDPRRRWRLAKMCLPFVDYYLPSIEEAGETFGSRDPRTIAERAFAAGVRKVVVLKRGSKGCYALPRGGSPVELPAFKVKVVDATGAGDCFDGGFLAGILRGFDLRDALRLGNAAGALNVSGPGGFGKLESFAQARRLAGI